MIHAPQDQLAVDGVGVVEGPRGGVATRLFVGGARARGVLGRRGQDGVVVRRGEQERQDGVTRQLVEMETVTAVTELVRDGQDVGEGGALGEGHRPLVQRTVHVFGHHHDGRSHHAAQRRTLPVGVRRSVAVALRQGARIHHDVLTQGVSVARRERHGDPGRERHLETDTGGRQVSLLLRPP